MGFRFRRRFKIFPGVTLNVGKSGVTSASVGVAGAHVTIGADRASVSAGIPGTGLSWWKRLGSRRHKVEGPSDDEMGRR